MSRNELIPWLGETNAVLECRNIVDEKDGAKYRVPIEHRSFAMGGKAFDAACRRARTIGGGKTMEQLLQLFADSQGVGLFAPRALKFRGSGLNEHDRQLSHGAVAIIPPHYWKQELNSLLAWRPDEYEDGPKVPFTSEDVAVFGELNFTPDRWYVVLRGPLEGKIFLWSHDGGNGDPSQPWADDLVSWGVRLRAESPEIFSDCIEFPGELSSDSPPSGARLRPERMLFEEF